MLERRSLNPNHGVLLRNPRPVVRRMMLGKDVENLSLGARDVRKQARRRVFDRWLSVLLGLQRPPWAQLFCLGKGHHFA